MPLYTVQHACPLSLSQKDELAVALTQIHSTKFTTPKNFVNVSFEDVSQSSTYVGGKRAAGNHIRANVRAGPSRTQEDWNDLCKQVERAWYQICGTPLPQAKGRMVPDTTLRSVIVMGGIIAGLEAGFVLPAAGGDVQWLEENWEEFNRRAEAGDEEMKGMVKEIQERGLLDGTNGLMTQQKKLEELLGWGDAA